MCIKFIYICYHILTLPLKRQHTVYGIVNYLLLTHPGAVCCVGPNHSASHPYLCLPRAHWRLLPWRRSLVPHTAALQSVKHEKTIKNVQLSYGQGIRQSVFRGRIHKNIWQVAEGTEAKVVKKHEGTHSTQGTRDFLSSLNFPKIKTRLAADDGVRFLKGPVRFQFDDQFVSECDCWSPGDPWWSLELSFGWLDIIFERSMYFIAVLASMGLHEEMLSMLQQFTSSK